ncbi:dihydroneopterin aldolase [Paenibacillus chitinolyticus]
MILSKIDFFGRHGLLPEENRLGQKYVVDLVLYLDLSPAGVADDLKLTINYADLYEVIKRVVEGPPVALVEALAENIASTLLDSYLKIKKVTVRVTKPNPPVAIHFSGLAVEIRRERVQERGI